MKKNVLKVPKGIRFISDWDKLENENERLSNLLPKNETYIMNKSITGCGYTEYCISNKYPTILCSPRIVLLENKEEQHKDMKNLLYLKNEFEIFSESYDRDISKDDQKAVNNKNELSLEEKEKRSKEYANSIKKKIEDHVFKCTFELKQSPKFLVTYDSFRRIKETLGESIKNYQIVIDEFQSIFCDSRFKPDTENGFLSDIKDLKNVIYLSATPMIDKYLDMLDEFKNLSYYELDWKSEDPNRVISPYLKTKQCKSIITEAVRIVDTYKNGKFEKLTRQRDDGKFEEVYSKEAVIFVNSVKNICDIIRKCNLKLDETNVLCSNTVENIKKVRSAFRKVDKNVSIKTNCLGKVPEENKPHKMFTLCTRTVYLGADFYSKCARTFILSDANVDCLAVDITLDLPQILGRQRLKENPWKNRAELYFRVNTVSTNQEDFNKYLEIKKDKTDRLLKAYRETSEKHVIAETYQRDVKRSCYRYNFVAVNEHTGNDLVPVFNNLVMISEMRAFEIQQIDYKDRFSVFSSVDYNLGLNPVIREHVNKIESLQNISEGYKYLCSLDDVVALSCLSFLPVSYTNYYTVLGKEKMIALRYNATDMKKEYDGIMGNQSIDIKDLIIKEFVVGESYSRTDIKNKLKNLYNKVGYFKTPKANDLEEFFELKDKKITNSKTGKRDHAFEIVKIKD